MAWVYAMYKGEDCLAIGTADEICQKMKIKKNTFHFYRTKTRMKRVKNKNKSRMIIRIDNEDDE
jgi:hypothetical protein